MMDRKAEIVDRKAKIVDRKAKIVDRKVKVANRTTKMMKRRANEKAGLIKANKKRHLRNKSVMPFVFFIYGRCDP